MDRAFLEQVLLLALQHIEIGHRNIARQREIVAELGRGGHAIILAMDLLANFEELQLIYVADRDRVLQKLAL
jgi:hypothetical protein